ncbi:MAG: protein-glutamate O-methyltransferase CheR [Gammaproteobacteria bacterium]|nr:protein-glutamate O-methyltransferase CheR [Gammaproteobacteria bacterium]MDH5652966.1 protein-glutamate O-methyltransferase CheR [Gammaproteobacteria bacterium]
MKDEVLAKTQYDEFRSFLEEACGIVLGENKHYLVTSRLNRLTQEFSFQSISAMLDTLKLGTNKVLKERIIDAMTTNETSWFRDNYPYEILRHELLPTMAKRKLGALRIWSAACSTGQEAYSISMTISEYQIANPGALPGFIEIVGTDISPTVLKIARDGIYDEINVMRGLSQERRERYFTHENGKWTLRPAIKNLARFADLNLLSSYGLLGRFDIIFCRNVLIYFSTDSKTDILNRMAKVLNPGGILILGGSESPTGYSPYFEMIRFPQGVIYKLKEGS